LRGIAVGILKCLRLAWLIAANQTDTTSRFLPG
jgi:hypothetical protein